MRSVLQKLLGFTCFALLVIYSPSFGAVVEASPTENIRKATEKITSILDDYVKNPEGRRDETINKIMAIADQYFDWAEMAKRSLARFWKERIPDEQNEFVSLFRELIKNAYIGKIESYSGEKVVFTGDATENNYSVVKTKIITPAKGLEVPVDYRLQNQGGKWMVYDVVIEGVSLVNNYRSQFNSILQGSSYGELVKRIKDKLAQDSKK